MKTRNGEGKSRPNQSGDKTKQSSNGERKTRSPKEESEKSVEPIPQEEPIRVQQEEVVEEIVISEIKPEVTVTDTEVQEEEPA